MQRCTLYQAWSIGVNMTDVGPFLDEEARTFFITELIETIERVHFLPVIGAYYDQVVDVLLLTVKTRDQATHVINAWESTIELLEGKNRC